MSRSLATQASLNLSQGVTSSSPNAILVEQSVEVVEDSMKHLHKAFRDGRTRPSQQAARQEVILEEDYDSSFEAKVARKEYEERWGAAPSMEAGPRNRSAGDESKGGKKSAMNSHEQQLSGSASSSSDEVDDSLERGSQLLGSTLPIAKSVVNKLISTKKRTTHPVPPPSLSTDESARVVAETQPTPTEQADVQPAETAHPRKAASTLPKSGTAAQKATNDVQLKARPATATSSLSKLRARRSEANPADAESEYQAPEKTPKRISEEADPKRPTDSTVKFRRRISEIQPANQQTQHNVNKAPVNQTLPPQTDINANFTPASKPSNEAPSAAKPQTSGKLKSIKNRGIAQTSARVSQPKAPSSELENDPISDGSNLGNDRSAMEESISVATGGNRAAKRSLDAEDPDATYQDPSADDSDQLEDPDPPRPRKKARLSDSQAKEAISQASIKTRTQVQRMSAGESTTDSQNRSTGRSNRRKAPARKTNSGNVRPNVRTRRMAQAENSKQENTASQPEKNTSAANIAPSSKKASQGAAKTTHTEYETLEEFEKAVISYGSASVDNGAQQSLEDRLIGVVNASKSASQSNGSKVLEERSQNIIRHTPKSPKRVKDHHAGSQNDPILLSDEKEVSSREDSPPPHQTVSAAFPNPRSNAEKIAVVPKTPIVYQSSPPRVESNAPANGFNPVSGSAALRPNIIRFDKTGPRNQGTSPGRKSDHRSEATNRSSLPPINRPPASATSSREKLEAKRKSAPAAFLTETKSRKRGQVATKSNIAEDVTDALASFRKQPKTKADDKENRTSFTKADTRNGFGSRQSMLATDRGGFADIDDFDESTSANEDAVPLSRHAPMIQAQPSDSQKAMPAPALRPSKKIPKPQRSSMLPSATSPLHDSYVTLEAALGLPPFKRRGDDETVEPPKKKRAINHQETGLQSAQDSAVGVSEANATTTMQQPEPAKSNSPKQDLKKDASQKPSRVASHGSQKVDMHGSPVPDGMMVPDHSTVLETYFQQEGEGVSSAVEDAEAAMASEAAVVSKSPSPAPEFVPTSHQPKRLSSNSKPVPAPPQDESRAITGYAKASEYGPQARDTERKQPADPFANSDRDSTQRRSNLSSSFTQQLRKDMAKQFGVKATPLVTSEVDPEKTLVGVEQTPRALSRDASLSPSSTSSSDTSSDSEESLDEPGDDLSIWRNALQPHQMDLFDELVTVVHRLIRHLVDKETAVEDMVEDYHKRGLQIIQRMERRQAEQVARLNQSSGESRKQLRDTFKQLAESLNECTMNFREALVEEQGRGITEEGLKEVMAEYC